MAKVIVIGGGLAGCEAAWQLAARGHTVELREQKPLRRTPAQQTDRLAELVCSNSLRGASLGNAVGLLKEELRRAGSLILACADRAKVPAGGALAVDREQFAAAVEAAIHGHPAITVVPGEVLAIPGEADRPVILATGPLTGDALAADLERHTGGRLAYYDAIAPIVAEEGLDHGVLFAASRWDKGDAPAGEAADAGDAGDAGDGAGAPAAPSGDRDVDGDPCAPGGRTCANDRPAGGDQAYLNAPMDRDRYEAFIDAVLAADKVAPHAFEEARYFEGCLPIEVMAARGRETLRHGPMKPVGLTDPRTGRWPHAVVQLRREDAGGSSWNLVGFQTRMTWKAQGVVLRLIPGLEQAEFVRFGSVHRNTFVDAPKVLDRAMQLRTAPGVFLAGQVTGVEGYVESTAGGLLCAVMLAQRLAGSDPMPPPSTTALGALLGHLARDPQDKYGFQPSNVTWGQVAPLTGADALPTKGRKLSKIEKYERMAARALRDLDRWLAEAPLARAAAR